MVVGYQRVQKHIFQEFKPNELQWILAYILVQAHTIVYNENNYSQFLLKQLDGLSWWKRR